MAELNLSIISNKAITLVGEVHGVKENLDVLRNLVRFNLEKGPLLVAFEWPKELEQEINLYLRKTKNRLDWRSWNFVKNKDGRFCREHLIFLNWLRKINSSLPDDKKIRISCFDVPSKNWNIRDKKMAENLLSSARERKQATLAIMGNLHARNKVFLMGKTKYVPLGSYLPKKETVGIKLQYSSGSFYNLGLKKIEVATAPVNLRDFEIKKPEKENGYDYIIQLKKAHAARPL